MGTQIGKHSWHGVKVPQMRNYLVEHKDYTREQVNALKGKAALIFALEQCGTTPADVLYCEKPNLIKAAANFDDVAKEENIFVSNKEDAAESNTPTYTDPTWHDYVMSKFTSDELFNKYPKCDGLRRVAELLLGDIITSKPTVVFPSHDISGPGRATVQYEIEILWKLDNQFGTSRIFGDVADVYSGNSPGAAYVLHTVATACTRAESRALRKALRLRTISFEETMEGNPNEIMEQYNKDNSLTTKQTGEWIPEDRISTSQEDMINLKCKEMCIDVDKFINKRFYTGESDTPAFGGIKEVPKVVAASMIQELVKYQSNTKESVDIPKEILL